MTLRDENPRMNGAPRALAGLEAGRRGGRNGGDAPAVGTVAAGSALSASERAPRTPRGPGSAPPLRHVTDAEVAEHLPLVNFTLQRLIRQGKLTPELEYEDLFAVGVWGMWEALRRFEPGKGALSTYLSSYIWGYVMRYQRDVTRATGWNRARGERLANVVSFEAAVIDDFTVGETLAAPDDTAAAAECNVTLALIRRRASAMHGRQRVIADAIVAGESPTAAHVVDRVGVSRQRVDQLARITRATLIDGLGDAA